VRKNMLNFTMHDTDSQGNCVLNNKNSVVKSGILVLIQSSGARKARIPVSVRVYRNNFEHYAVIQRGHKLTSQQMFVNLKHSCVQQSDKNPNEITVNCDSVDGMSLVFQAKQESDVPTWIDSLQSNVAPGHRSPSLSPVIPRANFMPVLQESVEEDD
jgi:hypothetical protein